MKLYHGSEKIIKNPEFGFGKPYNDYGLGFYLTKDKELAKEWSSSANERISYVNEYELDDSKLKILNLDKINNKVLTWIALLVNYRKIHTTYHGQQKAKDFLIKNYLIDVNQYDLIIGYRADDCYFMFARAFLNNSISLEQLEKALVLGKLGQQYVLKSKKAFRKLKFIKSEEVDSKEYYYKRILRNQKAANEYCNIEDTITNGIYLQNIIQGTIK